MGLPRLESVAHAGENILGKIRDGEIEVTSVAVSLVLECLDQIKILLEELEANEVEPEGEDGDLIARLNAFADGGGGAPAEPAAESPEEATVEISGEEEADEFGFVPVKAEDTGKSIADTEPVVAEAAPEPVADVSQSEDLQAAAVEEDKKPTAPAVESKTKAVAVADENVPDKEADAGSKGPSVASQTIRVNVDLLENLMTMISELVLTRN